MRGARKLKSVSRSLSDVGRRPFQGGALSRRPLSVPAITRMEGTEMTESTVTEGTEGTEGTVTKETGRTATEETERTGSHRETEERRRAERCRGSQVRPPHACRERL